MYASVQWTQDGTRLSFVDVVVVGHHLLLLVGVFLRFVYNFMMKSTYTCMLTINTRRSCCKNCGVRIPSIGHKELITGNANTGSTKLAKFAESQNNNLSVTNNNFASFPAVKTPSFTLLEVR